MNKITEEQLQAVFTVGKLARQGKIKEAILTSVELTGMSRRDAYEIIRGGQIKAKHRTNVACISSQKDGIWHQPHCSCGWWGTRNRSYNTANRTICPHLKKSLAGIGMEAGHSSVIDVII